MDSDLATRELVMSRSQRSVHPLDCGRTTGFAVLRPMAHAPSNRPGVPLEKWALYLCLAFASVAVSAGPCFAKSPGFSAVATPHLIQTLVDFDGDGILDHVRIDPGAGGSSVHIALSRRGSSSLNVRRARVLRVTGFDIDADGDLDLVALTDAGLVMWKNNGRGKFFRVKEAGRSPPSGPFWSTYPGASPRVSGWLPRTSDPVLRRAACGLRRPDSATRRLVVSPHHRSHSHFTYGHLRAPPALLS
jgi:hypothetical protein